MKQLMVLNKNNLAAPGSMPLFSLPKMETQTGVAFVLFQSSNDKTLAYAPSEMCVKLPQGTPVSNRVSKPRSTNSFSQFLGNPEVEPRAIRTALKKQKPIYLSGLDGNGETLTIKSGERQQHRNCAKSLVLHPPCL